MEIERRAVDGTVEVRAAEDASPTLKGMAAVFNKWSVDLGGFVERIAPNAFSEALKTSDIRALFNHDPNQILGRTAAGTLRVNETAKGLAYEVDLPETQLGKDIQESVARGDIDGNSFSFVVSKDEWEQPKKDGEPAKRTITEFSQVLDLGPVSFPAYPQTDVALRSLEGFKESLESRDAASRKRNQNRQQYLEALERG